MQHGVDWTGEDLTGWYLSEKFNGCRAYWDGRVMWSRGGHEVQLPGELRAVLPAGVILDGELYHDSLSPAHISNIMRGRGSWSGVCFVTFDAPEFKGFWPERMQAASASLPKSTVVVCVEHRVCTGLDDAIQELQQVRTRGGEGLMLRSPDHRYAAGRSRNLVKFTRSSLIAHDIG